MNLYNPYNRDFFLTHPETLDAQDSQGNTLLHRAIIDRKWNGVDLLLECGASPSIQNLDGETPLHTLVVPLHHMDYMGRKSVGKQLVRAGALLHIQDKKGLTPLIMSILCGWTEFAQFLIQQNDATNPFLDIQDHQGYSALHWAVQIDIPPNVYDDRRGRVAGALMAAGADLSIFNHDGQRAEEMGTNWALQGLVRSTREKKEFEQQLLNGKISPSSKLRF